jgi:monothiol glutaredoxin
MTLDPALKTKIDQLVASDDVVLFMKGTRSFPQCGFSASVVNILNTMIPKYTTVNILSDGEIRGGMKEYSDWPTFPQLFIKGEFVGGADIVRQMHESGDLEKKLGELVAPAKPPTLSVSARAAAELQAALKDGSPGDVIHLTITQGWEHQLDLGAKEASHVTVEAGGLTIQLDRTSAGRANGVSIDFIESAGEAKALAPGPTPGDDQLAERQGRVAAPREAHQRRGCASEVQVEEDAPGPASTLVRNTDLGRRAHRALPSPSQSPARHPAAQSVIGTVCLLDADVNIE